MAHRGNPHTLPRDRSVVGRDTELARDRGVSNRNVPPGGPGSRGSGRDREDHAPGKRASPPPVSGSTGCSSLDHLRPTPACRSPGSSDLFGELVDEVGGELPEPQERALRTALLREGDAKGPPLDPSALNAAVHGALSGVPPRGAPL